MQPRTAVLSKSRYLTALSCPAAVWYELHHKGEQTTDLLTLHILEQGNEAGKLARALYPGGTDALATGAGDTATGTQKLLEKRKPIYEAGFIAGELYARTDILNPAGNDSWDIVEVKATGEIKDEHIQDCSFQRYVCEKAGIKIRKVFLVYVNKDFVRKGDIDPNEFFITEDITERVEAEMEGIEERIAAILKIVTSKNPPKPMTDLEGCKPKDCPYEERCMGPLPDDSVFYLYRGGPKAKTLYNMGTERIKDIPKKEKLTPNQAIQLNCASTGRLNINKTALKEFLAKIKEPIYYMDFETYAMTIPPYDGMKPNQNITFQFSLHVQEGGKLTHHSYLAECGKDPRQEFLKELKEVLGTTGSIVVYNQPFEQSRLNELAEQFPQYADWVESLAPRYVDLLLPFRAFDYYDPVQKGSASIKQVLPALTGKSYEGMGISNGGDASVLYYRATTGKLDDAQVKKVRKDLLEYCGLDTEGMVWIVEKLKELVK